MAGLQPSRLVNGNSKVTSGHRITLPQHPDISWKERLQEVQEAYALQAEKNSQAVLDGFRVNRPTGRGQGSRFVPAVHTSHATEVIWP